MVPSRGKNKVEIRLCARLVALADAEGLQVESLPMILAPLRAGAPGPSITQPWGWQAGPWDSCQCPEPQSELVLFRSDSKHQGTCPAPRCLPSMQVRVERHKHVLQLQGRPSGPLRNVEMVFSPLRANVFW